MVLSWRWLLVCWLLRPSPTPFLDWLWAAESDPRLTDKLILIIQYKHCCWLCFALIDEAHVLYFKHQNNS